MKNHEFYAELMANPHSHIREGNDLMKRLVHNCSDGGVDVLGPMPNTNAGLRTAQQVIDYINLAKSYVPEGRTMHFIPIVMITEKTTTKDIDECVAAGILSGKVYPRLRTTKSENGVERYGKILPIVAHCGKVGMKVHLHPEHPSTKFWNRDAEFAFLPILRMYLEETDTIIVSEHGTDGRCIPHWEDMAESGRFFVTLTAHHLATNEDDAFGDVRTVCKPPIKTERDREALVQLVERDFSWVMAGADDAPHNPQDKHPTTGGCSCGCYTAPFLLPLYAHALDRLLMRKGGEAVFINFTSWNTRRLHNQPPSSMLCKMSRTEMNLPYTYYAGTWSIQPFWAGQKIKWSFATPD